MAKMFEVSSHMHPVVTLFMVLILCQRFRSLTSSCPQSCACDKSTEVHCTFRSLTAVPAGIPKAVESLNFGFNNIQRVSKELFDGLQRLELLILHGNRIQSLPDNVFKNLKSLQVLKMSYNKLTAITRYTFQGLENLRQLNLAHNKIEFIQPGAFYGMASLTRVHLAGNHLRQLHPNTFVAFSVLQHFKFSSIKHLDLSDNSIHTLPREMLNQMWQLESIYLQDNPWSCDCRLEWLLDWGKEAGDVVKCKEDRSNPRGQVCSVCSDPKQFSGKELFKLDSSEVSCTQPTIKSPLKKSHWDEWEADESEDTLHENYLKPLGSMTLNLTDEQGNRSNLLCRISSLRNEKQAQWSHQTEQVIAVNMTLSVKLTCPVNQKAMERLWKLIAYYSETPVKLKKDLKLSKKPLSYQYRQAVDSDSYYYTNVRATIAAEPFWLMQDAVDIKLDRKLTVGNAVVLTFSLQLSQQFPIKDATKGKIDWVLIKVDDRTKLVHVAVTGNMLQLQCQVVGSGSPVIQWVLPDGHQVMAPYISDDNRVSVLNTGRLMVKAVEPYDAGVYQCIGSVGDDTDTIAYRVVVQPAKVHAAQVSERGITVPYGETISLPCTASSVPDAQLTWILSNGSMLGAPTSFAGGYVMTNGMLVIRTGHEGNSGLYRCIAANRYGLDVLTVSVAVIKTLPSQTAQKGIRRQKFYPEARHQKESQREGSSEKMAHKSQKRVSYGRYTGGPAHRQRNLHADGVHHDSKRDIKLWKWPKGGRGMLEAEGRRRLASRRRISMTNKKIDPQKWADILAKVRGKSAPRSTATPVHHVHTSPPLGGHQMLNPTAKQTDNESPMAMLDVEGSSGNGNLNFAEDELIQISLPSETMVRDYTLVTASAPEIHVKGHHNPSKNQLHSPENNMEPRTSTTWLLAPLAKPEVLPPLTIRTPPVEVHPSEALQKFIESTQWEGGSDIEQGNVLKMTESEHTVESLPAENLDHPEAKPHRAESNSSDHITFFSGNPTITSDAPKASTVTTRALASKLPHTTTSRITSIATSTLIQGGNSATAAIIVPTSPDNVTASKPSTMSTVTVGVNTNTRAVERRRWSFPGSRRYGRRRRPGRRYRLNRLRQRNRLQLKGTAGEISTASPAVKVAPTEVSGLVGGQVKVSAASVNETTTPYHNIQPTTKQAKMKSPKVLTTGKSQRLGKRPTLVQDSNSTPTVQTTHETPNAVTEVSNHVPPTLHSKTLLIQSHDELPRGTGSTAATTLPHMVNFISEPPETSNVPVTRRAMTAVDIPMSPEKPNGAKDNSKTLDVIISPLVPITELPVSTTVGVRSKSVMNDLIASPSASNTQGLRNTPASNIAVKISTTPASEIDPKSSTLPPDNGISTVQNYKRFITPKIPSPPDVDRFIIENKTINRKGTEKIASGIQPSISVPGMQPTIGTSVKIPVLHSLFTFSEDKATQSPDVTSGGVTFPERESPTQLSVGLKEIEQDIMESTRTFESNALPDRFLSKPHTNGWQRLKERYTGKTNLTWIIKGEWKPSSNLSPMSIPNKESRRKSPKYILVEATQKTLREKPSYSTTGARSESTSEPNFKVFATKTRLSTQKPAENFMKPPATTVEPTIPVIFNKPGNKVFADLHSNSRTTKANYIPPLKESAAQQSNMSRGNQKFRGVQIPIQFTHGESSSVTSKTTTRPLPRPTQTTIPMPAATEQLLMNATVNRKTDSSLNLAKAERDSFNDVLPSPSFRATRTKPKIITNNPLTVSVKAEMDAYLPCEAHGEPKPVISWTKVSTGAVMTTKSKTVRFEVFGNGTFGIRRAEVQDRGQYLCLAQNPHGTDTMLVSLVVLAQQPRIAGARYRDATAYLGDPFLAECRAEGTPTPHVAWLLPGRRMVHQPGDAGGGLTLSANGTLSIRQAAFSDRGAYKCIASNAVGADTVVVRLHISALPPRILEQRTENVWAAPGKGVLTHCTAKAAPLANIRWILPDGMQIRPSQFINGNLFVFPNGTLYIRGLSQREVGSYECMASNIVGIARRTVIIGIQKHSAMGKTTLSSPQRVDISYGSVLYLHCEATEKPGPRILWRLPSNLQVDSHYSYSKRIKVHNNGTLVVQSVTDRDAGDYLCVARNNKGGDFMVLKVNVVMQPAKIKYKQDANHKVMYGKDLKVDCIASGLPDPEISWGLPDGTMVNSVLQSDDSGTRMRRYIVFDNGTLYFNEVGLRDEGDYICYAVNQMGKDEMKVNVKVLAEPPTFKGHVPSRVDVAYGETCSLKCEAKGEPTPWITWHSPTNKLISPSPKYHVAADGTLFIQKAQRSDSGNYTCTARNTAGERKRVVTVWVIIEAPRINGQRSRNTVVKETAMREARKIIDCKAEGIPIPRVMWMLSENIIVTAPYYGERIQVHQNGTLVIKSLEQSDGVQFVCIAHNEGGEAKLIVQLDVQNNLEKPSFTNPLSAGVAILIGNSVSLNCSSRGTPTPVITWVLPDGQKLMKGQRLPKMYHGSDGTLHISSPSATEAGSYRCIARNSVGSVERLVTLEVGHKPEIHNQYTSLVKVLPGESMRLDCVAGGIPLLQLSWILPSGAVMSSSQTVGRFSLLQNGSLIVREASVYDRGTYSCKAVSELGLTLMNVAVIVIAYPPRITSGPASVTYARHGASAQLNCMAMGIPRAEISWELPDRTRLAAKHQARLIGNKFLHPQGSLILQNLSNRDTGFYKCTAKNLLGSDSKITYVHVF
ncbi:matrix-remodeling-associated protein 5 [Narcine bancroftii]|uniref:matrix-remodeling-associated protein 5 n=1 Tax=Narcine bancroftii TaxID=1343680 RepID=UPI0038312F6D